MCTDLPYNHSPANIRVLSSHRRLDTVVDKKKWATCMSVPASKSVGTPAGERVQVHLHFFPTDFPPNTNSTLFYLNLAVLDLEVISPFSGNGHGAFTH